MVCQHNSPAGWRLIPEWLENRGGAGLGQMLQGSGGGGQSTLDPRTVDTPSKVWNNHRDGGEGCGRYCLVVLMGLVYIRNYRCTKFR